MKHLIGVSALLALTLSGCGTAPKTPNEFRDTVAGGAMAHARESFTVGRSSKAVAKTFQAKAEQCLNSTVNRSVQWKVGHAQAGNSMDMIWTPTFKDYKTGAELAVQMDVVGKNVVRLQTAPKGGFYVLVADIRPITKNKSEVDVYYSKIRAKTLLKAVKGWALGDDMSCPDLTLDAR